MQIVKISAIYKNVGLRKRTLMSDFRPDVEVWPFHTCTVKIHNITLILLIGGFAKIPAS